MQAWVERKHGETNFYLTQFLTGHGCFREYLHKYGHDDSTNCSFCDSSGENALRIFFSCSRYGNYRGNVEKLIAERVTPDNIVRHMIKSKLVWDRVRMWSAIVLQELRRKEWQRSESRRMIERDAKKE